MTITIFLLNNCIDVNQFLLNKFKLTSEKFIKHHYYFSLRLFNWELFIECTEVDSLLSPITKIMQCICITKKNISRAFLVLILFFFLGWHHHIQVMFNWLLKYFECWLFLTNLFCTNIELISCSLMKLFYLGLNQLRRLLADIYLLILFFMMNF
jgi:hypothetical protein